MSTTITMKQQILDVMHHECAVINHLLTKVPEGGEVLEYRPAAEQRTLLELQRYLTYCAIMPATAAVTGNWDHAKAMHDTGDALAAVEIAGAMDRQATALAELLAPLTDDDLRDRDTTLPWGAEVKLGRALLVMGVETLAAYRMQLFLYIKAAGNTAIDSADCWVGITREKPADG
jgi:hypothetical protein